MGKNKSTKADGMNTESNTQHLEDRRRMSKGANRKNAPSPKQAMQDFGVGSDFNYVFVLGIKVQAATSARLKQRLLPGQPSFDL